MTSPDSHPDLRPPAAGLREAAVAVVRALSDAGHTAYFAGGCVRDELLNRSPNDYDVATDATPDRIQALFRKTAAVGAAFGVVLVKLHAHTIEVATFRSDGSYSDNRRPDAVTFSTPEEDAKRRDFTVNALFLDPLSTPHLHSPGVRGIVIDLVNGLPDLAARTLRAVGDPHQRLAEDHLRALRAVRLAAKLDFSIDSRTADAIRAHASDLNGVSRERIGDELRDMFLFHHSFLHAIQQLHALGLDAVCFGTPPLPAVPAPRLAALVQSAARSFPAALAALELDRALLLPHSQPFESSKSTTSRLRRCLCLSNDESSKLAAVLAVHDSLHRWPSLALAARKRLAHAHGFAPALAIFAATSPDLASTITADTDDMLSDGIGLSPEPLLTGDHLVAAGFAPGPRFRLVLDRVYDAQLEGVVSDFTSALELAHRLLV